MKLMNHIVNLFLGRYVDAIKINGDIQAKKIERLEATMDGETDWMLTKKQKDDRQKRFDCKCKELD